MPLSDAVIQEVRRILAEHDIEGLIALGAPRDEYDDEARQVASEWQQNPHGVSVDSIHGWLRMIWRNSFNLDDGDLAKRDSELRAAAVGIYAAGGK